MLQITDDGLSVESFEEIYQRLVTSFKQIYGEDVNLASDTPDGQLLGLFAQEMSSVHQAVSFIAQMLDPYLATGHWLEQRALYAGIVRRTAAHSVINEVIINGVPRTQVPANAIFIDANKNSWVTTEAATLNEQGSARVTLRSSEPGDFTVAAGENFTLSTIIIGIEKITATQASFGGADEESDAQLLARFMMSHAINNRDDCAGLQAALANIPGVTKCRVYENYTGQTDANGVPGHSVNAVIEGGSEADIARVITQKKIGGCGLYGKFMATHHFCDAVRTVYFDRPNRIEVNVSMVLGRYQNFNDINKDEIVKNLKNIDFDINENVYASRIISQINATPGFYIQSLRVNNADVVNIRARDYAAISHVEILIDGE